MKQEVLDGVLLNKLSTDDDWDFNEWKLQYVEDCRAIVKQWSNGFHITDARESLRVGKVCAEYRITANDSCKIINDGFRTFGYNLPAILRWLERQQLDPKSYKAAEYNGITVWLRHVRAVEVVTPWGIEERRCKSKNKRLIEMEVDGVRTSVKPDDWVRFHGAGDDGSDCTVRMGEVVQVASYNLHYYGTVTGIKPKYIETYGCPNGLIHNTYSNILSRNRSERELAREAEQDANWSD